MEVWIKYNGKSENYTRYGKAIPKKETKIDLASFFGIKEEQCKQRIKDLSSDRDLWIKEHKGG